jgi:hypothetical protein
MSVRARYVRQRPDDSRRSVVQCSVIDQRRVTCTSAAAFSEPFYSFFSLSTLCAGCESPGTDNDAVTDGVVHGRDGMDRQRREGFRVDAGRAIGRPVPVSG